MISMKPSLKYYKENNTAVIECDNTNSKNIQNLVNRFGYEVTNVSDISNTTKFYIKVQGKEDFNQLKSKWKSAKKFI